MSSSVAKLVRFSDLLPSLPIARRNRSSMSSFSRVTILIAKKSASSSLNLLIAPNFCSKNEASEVEAMDVGDARKSSVDSCEGWETTNGNKLRGLQTNELMQKLKRYGVSGILSYGLLNTIYYLSTFLFVWFYFAPAPGRMGYAAATERFLKIMAMVWAGSQMTKIFRAGGALALAPFVDRGLSWFTVKFKFESEGKAFAAIAGLCFGLALILFFGLTLLWA